MNTTKGVHHTMHHHYDYMLPSAEKRAENARKMHAMHGATVRQLAEIAAPTLPHHDHDIALTHTEEADEPTTKRRTYGRSIVTALGHFQDAIAPHAELTRRHGDASWQDYLRLTEYDESGNPAWAIADHEESGNALYIWRRDHSDTDVDTALSTTRRAALGHGCTRLCHPANMDQLSQEDIEKFYLERVLEALTA